MSIVSEIKCSKCDRMYSGVRSKCTYCGARRISAGKYSGSGDNSRGKILIAVLIMSVFVAATGVLLFTTEVEDQPIDSQISGEGDDADDENGVENGHVSEVTLRPVEVEEEEPEEEEYYEEPIDEPIFPTSVSIRFNNAPVGMVGEQGREFSSSVGESLTLTVRVEPLGVEDPIEWESSDRAVFEITPTNPDERTEATFRAVGRGTATLTVSVGDISESVIVRVPN